VSTLPSARVAAPHKTKPQYEFHPYWRQVAEWPSDGEITTNHRLHSYVAITRWAQNEMAALLAEECLGKLDFRQVPRCLDYTFDPTLELAERLDLAPSSLSYMFRVTDGLSPRQWWDYRRASDLAVGVLMRLRLEVEALFFRHVFDGEGEGRREKGERTARLRAAQSAKCKMQSAQKDNCRDGSMAPCPAGTAKGERRRGIIG